MAPIPPGDLPILALDRPKQRCVLNMNIAGADKGFAHGASEPIASYIAELAAQNVDVITLQEVCSAQHSDVWWKYLECSLIDSKVSNHRPAPRFCSRGAHHRAAPSHARSCRPCRCASPK